MRNVLERTYGIGAPVMGSYTGLHMMGTDGRIYYAGASSGNDAVPPGVRLFRSATSDELTRWRVSGGKGATPTPFDVRAEVAAYEKQFAASAAGPKPNMGTMSDAPVTAPQAAALGFSSGALLIIAIVVGAVVFGGK